MYAATISSLEWGANQAAEYGFGKLLLSDNRLKVVGQLTDQLMAINFAGVIRIETHVANFCLSVAGADGYAPAVDLLASDCDMIGIAPGEAYEMGLGQSVEFANFVRRADQRSGGSIRHEIFSMGNSDPMIPYPVNIEGISADAWNRVAAANNRVEISVYPDNF